MTRKPAVGETAPVEAMPLERGQRVRLADQLYGQIFEQIVSGRLNVGDKLPSEHEICDRFGVSRPVVREALLRLRADGLVTAHQGLGTFVSHQPAPRLKTFPDVQNVGAYLRAQEVRVALEGDAARLAAMRRSDEQLHKIEQAHEAFVAALAAGQVSPEADLVFHASIAEASGNDFYLGVLESIHDQRLHAADLEPDAHGLASAGPACGRRACRHSGCHPRAGWRARPGCDAVPPRAGALPPGGSRPRLILQHTKSGAARDGLAIRKSRQA